MVYVAHDGHDRRTCGEVFLAVHLLLYGVRYFGRYIFCGEAKLFGHDVDGLGIKTLVDRYHHTYVHAGGDDVVDGHVHHHRKVIGCHKFGYLEHAAFGCCLGCRFVGAVCKGFALLFTPLRALLLALVFGGEAGKSLAHLLLYVLLVDFGVYGTLVAVFAASAVIAAAIVAALSALMVATAALSAAVAAFGILLAGLFDVDFLFAADALTLLAVVVVGALCALTTLCALRAGLAIAAVATLFFGFLFGAGRLVERCEVNVAEHLGTGQLGFGAVAEHFGFCRCRCGLSLRLGLGFLLFFGSFGLYGCGSFGFLLFFGSLGLYGHGSRSGSLAGWGLLLDGIVVGVKVNLAEHLKFYAGTGGGYLYLILRGRGRLLGLLVVTLLFDELAHFAVGLEGLHKYVVSGFVDTCVRVGIDGDAFFL